jgi:hypothetical protein
MKLIIQGGTPLCGSVRVSGAKNSSLVLMAASAISGEEVYLDNVPRIADVKTQIEIVRALGGQASWVDSNTLHLKWDRPLGSDIPYELAKKLRASNLFLGVMAARKEPIRIPLPGGCNIGSRPMDLHLKGLSMLGFDVSLEHGYIEDSRHKIRDRDDVANLQRMYYHIFKNVLSKRWPDKSSWILYPDQNTAIDWDTIEDILDIKSSNIEAYSNLFTKGRFKFRLKEEFNIREIVPCGSKYEPLIQLGDLYAGMAIYSRDSYNMYCHLSQTYFATVKQLSLFDVEIDNSIKPSRADKERCRLIFEFNKLCKSKKLGVSLDTYRGLRTRDPSNPINFWWYEPQHELDKAPLKQKY